MGLFRETVERPIRPFHSLILVILLIAIPPVESQESTDENVFAPFVSRLRISIRDPQVRITWEDTPELTTDYRIYRSDETITNESFAQATLIGDVAAGEEAYLDVPPAPGDYYYAVLAENEAGEPYRILIPGRNSSFRPVSITNLATPEEESARITGIEASVTTIDDRQGIAVQAQANRDGRELIVYRSTRPIDSATALQTASIVTRVASDAVSVLDLPVPGVGYYYAIVDSALIIEGAAEIRPGANATVDPVEIPIAIAEEEGVPDTDAQAQPAEAAEAIPTSESETEVAASPGQDGAAAEEPAPEPVVIAGLDVATDTAVRSIPLPFLQLQSVLSTGRSLRDPGVVVPATVEIAPETRSRVDELLTGLDPPERAQPSPRVLNEDRAPQPEGAEYTLRTILDGPIAQLAWEDAVVQLTNFLTLPLPRELEARAHFYRGQAYYFTGERQLAILEFLLARDEYYVEVERWLDSMLTAPGA